MPGGRAPPGPGTIIDGKYRVERTLGAGGMGQVVLAHHLQLQRAVAIKLVADAGDAELAERLIREARAASRLTGEHIARVHDVGQLPDGSPFLVMEYLLGRDLAAVIQEGRIPANLAALYVRQACEGVAEAHAAGIVHRDLKPANLFLTQRADGSPCVKVLDFGIARTLDANQPKLTSASMIIGSPAYMAPEQLAGKPCDARTDVWSLGVVLYELLTGTLPYPEPSVAEQYARILEGPPRAPRTLDGSIPNALSELTLRCLARSPSDRFPDARALGAALEPFADRTERFGFATEPHTLKLPQKRDLRTPIAIGTIGGVLALGVIAMIGARALRTPPNDPNSSIQSVGAAPVSVTTPSATVSALASAPPTTSAPRPPPSHGAVAPPVRTAVGSAPRSTATATASGDPFAHRNF